MSRAHGSPRTAEIRAKPRSLAVGAEFPRFSGISRNFIKLPVINSIANVTK